MQNLGNAVNDATGEDYLTTRLHKRGGQDYSGKTHDYNKGDVEDYCSPYC